MKKDVIQSKEEAQELLSTLTGGLLLILAVSLGWTTSYCSLRRKVNAALL